MKYIVPLFSQRNARPNLTLQNWDSFQAGFRMVMRGEKFAGVTWNPWWRERVCRERRKVQRRSNPDRRSNDQNTQRRFSETDIFQRLRLIAQRRVNQERRSGNERRRLVSGDRVVSLAIFIGGLGNCGLSDENAALLIRVCAALTTRETYESWKRVSGMFPFFEEPDWDEREHFQKFRVFALASVLDLPQPRTIHWKGQDPSPDHMNEVSRILRIFVRATPKARVGALRSFVDGNSQLEGLRRMLSGEALVEKRECLQMVWAKRTLKPKAFYEKLRGPLADLGIDLSPKPGSYRKQIDRLKKDAARYMALLSR